MFTELSPRQWAAQIARLKSLQARREALESVPERFRGLVKAHLALRYERIKHERDKNAQAEQGNP